MYNRDMGNYNSRDEKKRKSSTGYGDKYSSGSGYDNKNSRGGYDTRSEIKKAENIGKDSADNEKKFSSDYSFHEQVSKSENVPLDSSRTADDASLGAVVSAEKVTEERINVSDDIRQNTVSADKFSDIGTSAGLGYSAENIGAPGTFNTVTNPGGTGFRTDYPQAARTKIRLEAKNCSTWMIAGLILNVITAVVSFLGPVSLVVTIMGMVKVKSFFTEVGSAENRKMVMNAFVMYVSVLVAAVVFIIVMIGLVGVAEESSKWVESLFFLGGLGGILFATVVYVYLLYVWVKIKGALDQYC